MAGRTTRPTIFHIPVCPFSQRLEVLLALKGRSESCLFETVDVTKPRPERLLAATRGSTPMPVLITEDGTVLRESLVLLQYFEDLFPERTVRAKAPLQRAIESLLVTLERDFVVAGYSFVMNQDRARRDAHRDKLLACYSAINTFLVEHSPDKTFLFDAFGWAEAVFTPMFMRFWFLEYYEDFDLPETGQYARVRKWRDACVVHPAAQQVSREELVKLYYDYAKGAGNGALVPGRKRSSFELEPHWSMRPWPNKDKYGVSASDADLGLV